MINLILIAALMLHLLTCTVICRCYRKRIIEIPIDVLLLVMLIPVWGCAIVLLYNHALCRRQNKKTADSDKGFINHISCANTISHSGNKQEVIVPFEEALIMNDSNQRRSLMLNILNQNPKKHVNLFWEAACTGDVETTHYAVTTLSELQKDYELEIQKCQSEYLKNDKNYHALKRYSDTLYDYIASGLLDNDILHIQRKRLGKLLKTQRKLYPDDIELFFRSVNNELALENYGLVNELLNYMIDKWEENENVWILKIHFLAKTKHQKEIWNVLMQAEMRGIYFSRKGREQIDFWKQKKEKESEYEQEKRSVL